MLSRFVFRLGMFLLLFAAGSTGQTCALAGNQGPTQSSPPEKSEGIVAARNASGKDLTQAPADEKRHYYALLFATNDYGVFKDPV